MSSKLTYYRTGLVLLTCWILACNSRENNVAAPEGTEPAGTTINISQEQFSRNAMQLGKPQWRAFPEQLVVSGTIDVPPANRAVVSAVHGGFIKSISLLVGDRVRKGQPIAALENPEFLQLQQDYLETREQLPFKQAEYRRQKTLFEEKITSEKGYLQAESDYKTALARLGGLASQLELLHMDPENLEPGKLSAVSQVYAPISGSISRVNVRKGVYVSQATEIVEIVDNDHIHLELTVFEKDINKVRVGQHIRFWLPELSPLEYEAEVYLIGAAIGADRTVTVHAHLADDSGQDFLVGMFVRARIEIADSGEPARGDGGLPGGNSANQEAPPSLSLPETAVVSAGGQAYILILEEQADDGYRLRQLPVNTGEVAGGYIAVSGEGLTEESEVLISGAFNLIDAP